MTDTAEILYENALEPILLATQETDDEYVYGETFMPVFLAIRSSMEFAISSLGAFSKGLL